MTNDFQIEGLARAHAGAFERRGQPVLRRVAARRLSSSIRIDHQEQARAAARAFAIDGTLVDIERHDRGHIHATYISTWMQDGEPVKFLHQRMNGTVFPDIPCVMHNIERVTSHLESTSGLESMHALRLVPTRDGDSYLEAPSGAWRTYQFIEDTESYDRCKDTAQAFEAARAFGSFQAQLGDLDPASLQETIPGFFSTPFRVHQLERALDLDEHDRAATAIPEVRFALERRPMATVIGESIAAGVFPERIVHGDTKLNNVLFDAHTGKAVCIVDLDTCMSAYSLYDFGDLVRFTAATSAEDEPDLSQAGVDLDLYRALVEGYLETAGAFLTSEEIRLMPFAARLVTLTCGMRFLTDYLAGDVYFRTNRPRQNLDRARVQLRMVEAMERCESEMRVR